MAFSVYKSNNGDNGKSAKLIESSPAYANRFFRMTAVSEEAGNASIFGIAKEPPVIKYSTSWEAGPTTIFADKFKEFMSHDIIKLFASQNGNYKPMVATDSWTQLFPKAGIQLQVPISFRAYPTEMYNTINYFKAIGYLISLTTPKKFQFSDGITIIEQAIQSAAETGYDIGESLEHINSAMDSMNNAQVDWSQVADMLIPYDKSLSLSYGDVLNKSDNDYINNLDQNTKTNLKNLVNEVNSLIYVLNKFTEADGVGIESYTLSYGNLYKKSYNKWVIESWSFKPAMQTTIINKNGEETICPIYVDFDITLKTAGKIGTADMNSIFLQSGTKT